MSKGKSKRTPGRFTRFTLTIPTALKDELDADAANENWSAWAAECFRTRLREIKATKQGRRDLCDVITNDSDD
jgi:hypothetical protein